jgi:hypothetical protein
MRKTTAERIAEKQQERLNLDSEIKSLIQQQKAEERKERTDRQIKRGELLEKLLPDTVTMSDEQFKAFLETTLLSNFSRKQLDGLTSANTETTDKSESPSTTDNTATSSS